MPAKLLTCAAIALLVAGTAVLAAFSSSCNSHEGPKFGDGGVDETETETETETSGVVGCPEDEAFALELVEEGDGTCTFQISISLDDTCSVDAMELHGAGATPGEHSLDVALGGATEDDLSPGASFHEEYDWTTPLSAWTGRATELNGLLTVVVTLGEVESCAALGTLYVHVYASELGDD